MVDNGLTACLVDNGLKSWSDQNADDKIGICCLSTQQLGRVRAKTELALNQNNMSNGVTCLPTDFYFSKLAL